jgi:phosphoenolpyruvate---glycerone phosphotransferase subunit DhaL
MHTQFIIQAIEAVHKAILAHEAEIESLDRAIGDGDHFINLKRGASTILDMRDTLANQAPADALQAIGMKLLSTIGGASGPLFACFFMAMAKTIKAQGGESLSQIAQAFDAGVVAIGQRGKSGLGEKTMLDTLIPVAQIFLALSTEHKPAKDIYHAMQEAAKQGMLSTKPMLATKGRAAGLGERAIGHIDAGAKSSQVMINAVCDLALKLEG